MAKRKVNTQPFWRLVFLIYIGALVWLLFCRKQGWKDGLTYAEMLRQNMILKPFYTIDNYINVLLHYPDSPYYQQCLIELFGNLLMFIPAGWLLPRIFKPMRKFSVFFMTCLFSILFIETFQLLTLLGYFDIDDVILNMIGVLIGFIGYICFRKK